MEWICFRLNGNFRPTFFPLFQAVCLRLGFVLRFKTITSAMFSEIYYRRHRKTVEKGNGRYWCALWQAVVLLAAGRARPVGLNASDRRRCAIAASLGLQKTAGGNPRKHVLIAQGM